MSNEVTIDYTNHRGERRERRIVPKLLWFGMTEHHQTSQWLLDATDVEKGEPRTFALRDVHSWQPVVDESELSTLLEPGVNEELRRLRAAARALVAVVDGMAWLRTMPGGDAEVSAHRIQELEHAAERCRNELGPEPTPCRQCGAPVESERECYATPVCFACLPPPPPIPVRPWGADRKKGGEP
jgi:hypothetical protein